MKVGMLSGVINNLCRLLLISGGMMLAVNAAYATADATQDKAEMASLLNAYHQVHGFSGTVKVVRDEETVFEQSIGLADRSFDIAMTPSTRNSINSISKTFTGVAVLMLVRDNKLELDKPVGLYLPYLTATWRDEVTIHHLLTHTSGLPRESGIQWYQELTLQEQARELVDKQALQFSPGEQYAYSNSGVTLLGAVLEAVSGMDYADVITQQIITPLKLTNTGVYRGRAVVANQAVPYRLTPTGLTHAQRTKHLGVNAGGGLYSTADDLYRFMVALQEHTLLPAALTDKLFAPHIQSGEGEYEGYLWSIKTFGDERLYFSAGSGYGTKSVMIRSPERGDFIAITSNWGNTPILPMLRDVFLLSKGQPVDLPQRTHLADPSTFTADFGSYTFEPGQLKKHLGADSDTVTLHEFDGRLFMNEELLAAKSNRTLGLTYTDEVSIRVGKGHMQIVINGISLEGVRR
ncbi:serine hydrolase domain-containing protein [Alteromonas sp. CYL-A6]|uniref:serine hydrolase domain-containing protein n=1 Tax=Alteromonas nitratireducens TaxID=3390813 RepID=UPI0034BD24D6